MLTFASGGSASKAGLRGANHAQIRWNFDQSDCKSLQAPTPKRVKRRGLGGYADAKLPAGDCASGLGLLHANHVFIQSNFPRVTDIATVFKSLLDSLIAPHLHTTSSSNRYCDSFKVPPQNYSL